MKPNGRITLFCVKLLPCKRFESFKVIVDSKKCDEVVRNYRERGYMVRS